ncbi:MAG: S-methyl-5-thioribose-1-phosphate isomerase [Hyphomicrobium sp.]
MKIGAKSYRTIWRSEDGHSVDIIDQTLLPHAFKIHKLKTLEDVATAIRTMQVRGAPLIGVTAAYGIALALHTDPSNAFLEKAIQTLALQRPTAVNLRWALDHMRSVVLKVPEIKRSSFAFEEAERLAQNDVASCKAIGEHGIKIIRQIAEDKGRDTPVHILTHCNAGWLACVEWGTATSPIYHAQDAGIPVHVYVDETRPRNQGAALTAYELGSYGVPYTLICDNAGGHLMQTNKIDLVIVGADRVTAHGDVANKIGTYLKALAAWDNNRIPFYVAMPHSTIDWGLKDGKNIPIEERSETEVLEVSGRTKEGQLVSISIAPRECRAENPAFDITPARFVTGFITERGVCSASREGLLELYPEKKTLI